MFLFKDDIVIIIVLKKRKVGKRKEETSSSINKSLINELFNIDVNVNLYYSFLVIANVNVIVNVIEDKTLDNAEQLRQLKEYLSEMLASDKYSVIDTIKNLKEMLELEEVDVPEVLIEFESYVQENF